MKSFVTLSLLLFSAHAWAEVSDKIPSVMQLWLQGSIAATLFYFLCRFRPWLVFVCAPIAFLFLLASMPVYDDPIMYEAIVAEQGCFYFVSGCTSASLTVIGVVLGYMAGKRRRLTISNLNSLSPR